MRHTSIGGMRIGQPVEELKRDEETSGLGVHPDIKKPRQEELYKISSARKSHISNEEGKICRICFDEN